MLTKELKTLRQVFSLFRRINIHPAYFVPPVLLSIAAAAFEGVSMGLLIPMLEGFLTKDYSFIKETPVLKTIVQILPEAVTARDRTLFLFLLSIFVISVVLKNVLKYCAVVAITFISERSIHHLRKELFRRYMSFGKLYFDNTSVGHHTTVMSEFIKQSLKPFLVIDRYMNAFFSLLVYLLVMFLISWKLTIFALPIFAILHLAEQ